MTFFGRAIAVIALVLCAVPPVSAQVSTHRVQFERGTSGTVIADTIRGQQIIDYVLGVSAGQQMSVQLATNNASNYFNVTAPGASAAIFSGSIEGNSANIRIPSSGEYTIRVYLMRNAARRDEVASYTLRINVGGSAAGSAGGGASGNPEFWRISGLTAGDTLNVRSSASAQSRVLGTLSQGSIVENYGCHTNGSTRWCQVGATNGLTGWVSARFLSAYGGSQPSTTAPQPVLPSSSGFLQITGASLNIRSGPSTQGAVVGVAPQGSVVNNLGCRSSWCNIRTADGVTGWASARYLSAHPGPAQGGAGLPSNGGAVQLPGAAGPQRSAKCQRSPDACLTEARNTCGVYAVVDSRSYAGGLISDVFPGPVTWYELTYQCGPSNGRQATFPFRGPSVGVNIPTVPAIPPAGSGGSGQVVAQQDMGRYCVGEASGAFSVRPQEISTLPLERSGGQYIVYGQYPPDGSNVTTFQCYFDSAGRFIRVER